MVYTMVFNVDGGCRGNGYRYAIGAAAACLMMPGSYKYRFKTSRLSTTNYDATNQRAEILAITMALKWALEKYDTLDSNPELDLTINSDSQYAVDCMNEWIYKWVRNGWTTTRGQPVKNRDLIEVASDLDDRVKELGIVEYVYIPREDNQCADKHCNEALDEMEDEN
ncbi:ribonuclease H-like domain-containing protein [Annulohypoxylon maeteangense]|uniref:ribonuclease H-like domain-containing protein n=1 Tax=Annulohypoxylon maeteangense TaxID=1927788 RepID=UPI0020089E8B|nr:ribonuclease H-like domain-containing protein [Annulohypoxylon maeteangense]KAI0886543.1 ribonuclease H-like domain-containing protein [Annulohypoxylon maeteangense]